MEDQIKMFNHVIDINPPSINIRDVTALDWMAKRAVFEAYFSLSNIHSARLHPLATQQNEIFGRLERSN